MQDLNALIQCSKTGGANAPIAPLPGASNADYPAGMAGLKPQTGLVSSTHRATMRDHTTSRSGTTSVVVVPIPGV